MPAADAARFPIKFNGSIFVVDNDCDADFAGAAAIGCRTRDCPIGRCLKPVISTSMLTAVWHADEGIPTRKLATKTYYGHDGAFSRKP